MTTKELIKKANELGFRIVEENGFINVTNCYGNIVATIYDKGAKLILHIEGIRKTSGGRELIFSLYDYASTPIVDRVEEEKFYWRLRVFEKESHYLNYDNLSNRYFVGDNCDNHLRYIVKFTKKEYDKLVEDELIADIFEKEEIEN